MIFFQHRLKSSQREKAREFAALTQTGEKTALFCLAHHDWKLDVALDGYFANPELYFKEPKVSVDRKKLETLYSKYKGVVITSIFPLKSRRHLCFKSDKKPLVFSHKLQDRSFLKKKNTKQTDA